MATMRTTKASAGRTRRQSTDRGVPWFGGGVTRQPTAASCRCRCAAEEGPAARGILEERVR